MSINLIKISSRLTRRQKQVIFVAVDAIIIAVSIYLAFSLRFDTDQKAFDRWWRKSTDLIILAFPIKLVCFWLLGIYRPVLRYMGAEFLKTAIISIITSTGVLALIGVVFQLVLFPRSIFMIDAIIALFLIISTRVGIRWLIYQSSINTDGFNGKKESIIIYGAGEAGSQIAKSLSTDNQYRIVAFVDDDKKLCNSIVSGIKVKHIQEIPNLLNKQDINSILLALPDKGKQEKFQIIKELNTFNVQIKTIPRINEIVSGQVSISDIRNIDIVDLLGREEISPHKELLQKNNTGKSVLVTGAGGSIGSELCRQIAQQNPLKIVLYEVNEFALYQIDLELKEKYPKIEIISCLGCVTNQ